MKKFLFALLGCSLTTFCFAEEKIYVNSKDIMVADFSLSNTIDTSEYLSWICQNKQCLHHNPPWNKTCSQCGKKAPNHRDK